MGYFGKQNHQQRFDAWSADLVNHGRKAIIERVQALPVASKAQRQVQDKLLHYYQTNACRMHYPAYRQRSLQIGSGAIEATHRSVVQCRLKLSGQRWSRTGAQNVLNLRTLRMSGRWHQLRQTLRAA